MAQFLGRTLLSVKQISSQSIFKVQMIGRFHSNSKSLLPKSSSKPDSSTSKFRKFLFIVSLGVCVYLCLSMCQQFHVKTIVSQSNVFLRLLKSRLASQTHLVRAKITFFYFGVLQVFHYLRGQEFSSHVL